MRILAIETSCDETGISILETRGTASTFSPRAQIKVLANELLSQAKLHAQYGGVFPTVARREHAKSIVPLIIHALKKAGLHRPLKKPRELSAKEIRTFEKIFYKEPELFVTFQKELLAIKKPAIDAIAVTAGPGLEPALWVGINTAQALGVLWGIPVIPVNHMEGHIVAALLAKRLSTNDYKLTTIQYPALALLISGGHTELVLMPHESYYQVLGQTRDDAVGEAFDKVARMLGLAYPGGPEISKLAEQARNNADLTQNDAEGIRHNSASSPHESAIHLPRPMLKSGDFDFSFAGLKTAVLYTIKNILNPTAEDRAYIAKEFEDAATEVLVAKTLSAAKKFKVREIILGGGVTANKKIRETFRTTVAHELPDVKLFIPTRELSTDNGLMIGIAGLLRARKPKKNIRANGTLRLANTIRA